MATSGDSLAYFALRDDRLSVRGGDALVSWAPVGVVALAAGDPLGPPASWPAAAAAFLAEADAQGRVSAVLGCGTDAARVWRAAGLTTIYPGDEAVLELDRFTLEGRAVRIARQSWRRARRAGITATVCGPASSTPRRWAACTPWPSAGGAAPRARLLNGFWAPVRPPGRRRLPALGVRRLSRRFPIQSLYQFNKKFAPAWQPRYLAVRTAEELVTVVLACLRAEGLLTPGAWAARSR